MADGFKVGKGGRNGDHRTRACPGWCRPYPPLNQNGQCTAAPSTAQHDAADGRAVCGCIPAGRRTDQRTATYSYTEFHLGSATNFRDRRRYAACAHELPGMKLHRRHHRNPRARGADRNDARTAKIRRPLMPQPTRAGMFSARSRWCCVLAQVLAGVVAAKPTLAQIVLQEAKRGDQTRITVGATERAGQTRSTATTSRGCARRCSWTGSSVAGTLRRRKRSRDVRCGREKPQTR